MRLGPHELIRIELEIAMLDGPMVPFPDVADVNQTRGIILLALLPISRLR